MINVRILLIIMTFLINYSSGFLRRSLVPLNILCVNPFNNQIERYKSESIGYQKSKCLNLFSSTTSSCLALKNLLLVLPLNLSAKLKNSIHQFQKLNSDTQVMESSECKDITCVQLSQGNGPKWVRDCFLLEEMFLGRRELNITETVDSWKRIIESRYNTLFNLQQPPFQSFGDGGKLQKELDIAMTAITQASFLSKYLQFRFKNNVLIKDDKSPVTIADYAVQALVVNHLYNSFPNDKFIAEETSLNLKNDNNLRLEVVSILQSVDSSWSEDQLLRIIDVTDTIDTSTGRVWILDPIDGTKGFIRGEHFCIALALLQDGIPKLSVLSCPNLSFQKVLSRDQQIEIIERGFNLDGINIPNSDSGSICFATTGHGAFCRSLTMPIGAANEVSVSFESKISSAVLCESTEASFGSREITRKLSSNLNICNEYLHLDGQCKSAIVGAGAAEASLRIPPKHYQEKIWDIAPGYHFVKEANGQVSDLDGNDLDFTLGRNLSPKVAGVIFSNGKLHDILLENVSKLAKDR